MGKKEMGAGWRGLTAAVLLTAGLLLAACQSRGQPNRQKPSAEAINLPEGQESGAGQENGGEQESGAGQENGGEQASGAGQENGGEQAPGAGQNNGKDPTGGKAPGEIRNGVYTGDGGRFTVKADEALWEVSVVDDDWELRLIREPSVWISFSPSEGVSPETMEDFETDFADSYAEAVKEGYPDARIAQIRLISDRMAGLDLTMTDPTGRYQMYQMLYVVTDGTNGYLITSTLSEEEEKQFRPAVEAVIESFEFQD